VREDTRTYQVQRDAAHQKYLSNQSHNPPSLSAGADHAGQSLTLTRIRRSLQTSEPGR
jgi:hypothetical protein